MRIFRLIPFGLLSGLLLFTFSLNSLAQTLQSLREWSLERHRWENDISEVGYLGIRCFANFTVVGGYFAEKGNTTELINRGQMYLNLADSMLPAIYFFESQNGYTTKDTETRMTRIVAINLQTIALNKDLHNNAFHGSVGDDFKFCNEKGPFFVEFSGLILRNNPK